MPELTTFEQFLEKTYDELWILKKSKDLLVTMKRDEEDEIDFLINRIDNYMGR